MGRSSPAAPPRPLTLRRLMLSTRLLPRGSGMFEDARLFNSDLNNWDVSKVQNTGCAIVPPPTALPHTAVWCLVLSTRRLPLRGSIMFRRASSFNSDLSNWDVSKVEEMKCAVVALCSLTLRCLVLSTRRLPRAAGICSSMPTRSTRTSASGTSPTYGRAVKWEVTI